MLNKNNKIVLKNKKIVLKKVKPNKRVKIKINHQGQILISLREMC